MATATRARNRKAEEAKPAEDKAEEEVTQTPSDATPNEEDNSEAGKEVDGSNNNGEEISDEEKDFERLPGTDSLDEDIRDVVEAALNRIMTIVHDVEAAQAVVLRNSLTDEGIEYLAKNGDNEDIVKLRTDHDETASRIADLEAELETLKDKQETKWAVLFEKAREVLKEDVNDDERLGAEARKTKAQKKYTTYRSTLETEVETDEPGNEAFAEFIREMNSRVYAGQKMIPTGVTTGNTRTPADREKAAEVRQWAKNNGIRVNERGRIPETILKAWEVKNPERAKYYASL